MSAPYEITVEPALAHWFIERFQAGLARAGFSLVLRTGGAEGTVWEYGRGRELLSISSQVSRGETAKVTIACESNDLASLLSSAVREATAEFVATFMEPLVGTEAAVLHGRVQSGLESLWAEIQGEGKTTLS